MKKAVLRRLRRHAQLCDRFWLMTMGMVAIVGVIGIALVAIRYGLPEKVDVLMGTIVGGLLMFGNEIVKTVRGFWTDDQLGQMSDHLAGSAPGEPRPRTVSRLTATVEEGTEDVR